MDLILIVLPWLLAVAYITLLVLLVRSLYQTPKKIRELEQRLTQLEDKEK